MDPKKARDAERRRQTKRVVGQRSDTLSQSQRMKPSQSSNSPMRYVPQKMTPAEPPAPPKKQGYDDYKNRKTLERIFSESKSVKTNKKRR